MILDDFEWHNVLPLT